MTELRLIHHGTVVSNAMASIKVVCLVSLETETAMNRCILLFSVILPENVRIISVPDLDSQFCGKTTAQTRIQYRIRHFNVFSFEV